ncbi:MAG: AAA family ATPase [Candidatus Omnitrophica bacterium]|nr:AAA family ATPase [Candidatus Omnitrophota bacterium]
MKIAISGKGGTGKTTIAAGLGIIFSQKGNRVILIDADPDSNLQTTLGYEGKITPLVELKSLIKERTGATQNGGIVFRLNPKVDDIPEKFFVKYSERILLGILGTIRGGGLGCACPENAFLKALLRHLILTRNDVVILDMEAGVEHLGRGTTQGIDWLLIIAEPGKKSVETTIRIHQLGQQLGIRKIGVILNKIRSTEEETYLRENLKNFAILGVIPYYEEIQKAELSKSGNFWKDSSQFLDSLKLILNNLE